MNYYPPLAFLLWAYVSLWFLISLFKRRNDVADVAWGLGFVLLAWTSFLLAGGSGARGLLVCILVSIWGVRLAWHIHARHRGKAEDFRYMAWRREWGKWFYARSYDATSRKVLRQPSPGMSSDFEIAIEEGSTMIRVGSMLLGNRLQ